MKARNALVAAGKDPTVDASAPSLALRLSHMYRDAYQPHNPVLQEQLRERFLKPLADRLFFPQRVITADTTGIFDQHVVQSGDQLNELGRRYGLSYQFMNMLRGRRADGVEVPISS